MNREERIAWLEEHIFILSMKDRWNREDWDLNSAWHAELMNLRREEQ